MKIELVRPRVLHLQFETRLQMTLAMCRMQEFYESPYPHIRAQYFSFEDFIAAYAKPDGTLDYFNYWDGFNIPPTSIAAFKTVFDDKSNRELRILSAWELADKPYLIATDSDYALAHEIAHARWHMEPEYRANARVIIEAMTPALREELWRCLKANERYVNDPQLLDDEIQAYVGADDEEECRRVFPTVAPADLLPFKQAFAAL